MGSDPVTLLDTRQIQMLGLEMLRYFDDLCRQNDLRYFLSGGTLLGAVRHHGFIPWDDDVDVMMPRPDYDRLCLIVAQKNHARYAILSDAQGGYAAPYLRVLDTYTRVIPSQYSAFPIPNLFLDIFPIEGLPDSVAACRRFYRRMRAYDIFCQAARKAIFMPGERLQLLKRIVRAFARMTGGNAAWCRRFSRAAQRYAYGSTRYVGVCVIAHYGMRERMPVDVFSSSVPILFEGQPFPAPIGYETYLRSLYGDYMKLPPEKQRHNTHGFQVELRARDDTGDQIAGNQ